MSIEQVVLAAGIASVAVPYVRGVAREVEAKLPAEQQAKIAKARASVSARTAPVMNPARTVAGVASAPVRRAAAKAMATARQQGGALAGQFIIKPPAAPPRNVVPIGSRRPAPSPAPAAAPATTEVPKVTANDKNAMTGVKVDVLTPGSAGADLFTAAQSIISHAMGGGVRSKLRAITQFGEALGYEASSLETLAMRMAEPDQSYGSAAWEPITQAAALLRAAQSVLAESGSALRTLINITVGEAAGSGTRVPHHDQINSGL